MVRRYVAQDKNKRKEIIKVTIVRNFAKLIEGKNPWIQKKNKS